MALELRCAACGTANVPGERFCGECGAPLEESSAGPASVSATQESTPAAVAERRLVTVLFADLVAFTAMSEHRDPEDVRDLLSQYFDRCRSLIERYGGTVEKFIGDAVMAVWGTPVAREDDAERAVRAALALTQAVWGLGEQVDMPELSVRAGVLTGNATVELGAEAEGMVLGDTVNTASRLQSIQRPARCWSMTSRAGRAKPPSPTKMRECTSSRAATSQSMPGRRCGSLPGSPARAAASGWRRRSSAAIASSRR